MAGRVKLRALEECDLDAMAEIWNCPGVINGTLQLPFRSQDEAREFLSGRDPNRHRLVATLDDRVVGSVQLRVESTPRRRHCGALGLVVHDQFQGQGIGTALLGAAIDLADNWLGLERLELTVYVDNAAAIHLYQKFGFVHEGTLRRYALRQGRYSDVSAMARLRPTALTAADPH